MAYNVYYEDVEIGQDNEYVYKTLLHYTDEEYDRLAADGLIGTTYPRSA